MTGRTDARSLILGDSIRVDLDRVLGRGGMSDVYAGARIQDGAQSPCAVKFLKRLQDDRVDPELARRFQREIKVLRGINEHQGVVRLYEAGVSERGPWYAMELIEAPTLRTLMKSGPMPEAKVRGILRGIAGILADLFGRHGVVHRDIKPDNVFVLPDGRCKIADLGLAKVLGRGQTALTSRNGSFFGTIQYVPPEVVTKPESADDRSDIYSFGVLGYEMLTGANPFLPAADSQPLGDPGAILAQQIHAKPVPPREFLPRVTPGFEDFLLRCMAKDPRGRPQSWTQVLDELSGKTPARGGRSRRRTVTVTAVGLLLLAGLVFAVNAWGPWRQRPVAIDPGSGPDLSRGQGGQVPDGPRPEPGRVEDSEPRPGKEPVPTPEELLRRAGTLYRQRDIQGAWKILSKAREQGHSTDDHHVLGAKLWILERNLEAARSAVASAGLRPGHLLVQLVDAGRRAQSLASSEERSIARLRELIETARVLAELRVAHASELLGDSLLHAGVIYFELLARMAYDPGAAEGTLIEDARALDSKFEPPPSPESPIDCASLFGEARAALMRQETAAAEKLIKLKAELPSRFAPEADSLASELSLLQAALAGRNGEVLKAFENRRLSLDQPGHAALSLVAGKIRQAASLTENPLKEIEWTPRVPPQVREDKVFFYLKDGALVLEAETDMGAYTSNLPFARHGFELGLSFSPANDDGEVTLFLTFAKGEGGTAVRVRKDRLLLVEHITDGKDGKDGTLYAEVPDRPEPLRIAAIPYKQWLMVLLDDRPWYVLRHSKPVPDNLMISAKKGTLRLASLKVGEKPKDSKDQGDDR